ncbi:MAG: tetratricopeptide repeat protein [Xanthomonadales bacterium]|nr:tetratricopeptide repeat protein [Xanthomonadales bacterium]
MSFWLLAVAIPVVASLLLFRPLLKERRWLPLGLTLLLLLPASGLLLYQWVGTPQAVHSSRAPAPVTGNEMDALLAQLQARMEAQPDDLEGWLLLGRSYKQRERFPEALAALRRAREVAPADPMVAVELAEALVFNAGPGQAPPEASALLQEALAIRPEQQKGLWLAGMLARQAGDTASAVAYFERLLPLLEPDSSVAESVQGQLLLAQMEQDSLDTAGWAGVAVEITAESLPELPPEAALFVIARDPEAPRPPLGAVRLPAVFPANVVVSDRDSMLSQRPISSAARIEWVARLVFDGDPLSTGTRLESDPVITPTGSADPIRLQLRTR